MRSGFVFLILMFILPSAAAGTEDTLIADVNRELVPLNQELDPWLEGAEPGVQSNLCFTYDRYDLPHSIRIGLRDPDCGARRFIDVSVTPRPGGGYDITVCVEDALMCYENYIPPVLAEDDDWLNAN